MSVVGSNVLAGASGQSGGGGGGGAGISRSLRFTPGDSAYLNRTPSSASNRKKWTWSGWVKRSGTAVRNHLFAVHSSNDNSGYFRLAFQTDGVLIVGLWSKSILTTVAKFNDFSAWYHLVLVLDTGNSTAADQVILYVNGVRQSVTGTADSNADYAINSTQNHYIGWNTGTSQYFNGYLADVHFIDGQALAPTNFGEYNTDNLWVHKGYGGTYGTNGFHLDFADNSSSSALGNDAAGSNNWSVNNLTAGAAKESANWPAMVTGSAFNSANSIDKAFDGSDSNGSAAAAGTALVFTPSTAITGISKVRIKALRDANQDNEQDFKLNGTNIGGSWSLNSTASVEFTVNNLTSLLWATKSNSQWYKIYKIEIYYGGSYKTLVTNTAVGASIDSLIDIPTNGDTADDTGAGGEVTGNYCTWNALDQKDFTLTNGNLDATSNAGAWRSCRGTIGMSSGKWYWEVTVTSSESTMIGIATSLAPVDNWAASGAYGWIYNDNGNKYHSGSYSAYGATYDNGDIIGVAFDAGNGSLAFYKNGASQGTAYTGLTSGPYFPVISLISAATVVANFGARAFAHAAPSSYKSLNTANLTPSTIADGSKYFDTKLYAGNGGTQSITMDNSALSPDFVWIKCRNDAFEHQLFDSVRGALKSLRSDNTSAEATVANSLTSFDSNGFSLGASQPVNNTKNYAAWAWDAGDSNTTIAAGSLNSSLYNTSSTWSNNWTASGNGFGSQPPSYGFDANFDNNINNNAGGQYVTWNTTSYTLSGLLEINCYSSSGVYDVYVNGTKASDTPSSRGWINCGSFADINEIQFGGTSHNSATGLGSAGILIYEIKVAGKTLVDSGVSITTPSLASTVRADPSAGFSIVSYAGNSVNNSTISHGLNGSVPELIITKNLSAAYNWIVYSAELAATKVLALDEAQGAFTPSGGYYGTVGSSTYQLVQGSSNLTNVNNNGNNYVAYCFAPVAGYSAMGSFLGNGSADGPFVFTGFRPAFILVKNSSVVDNWEIYDSTRSIANPTDHALRPDTSGVEFSHISNNRSFDILSNGFKIRGTNAGINGNGNTLVYYAVAEHPFQSSRAR